MEGKGFKVNDEVYWTDPEGISSDVYVIKKLYEEYCLIANPHSEAEVPYNEIKLWE